MEYETENLQVRVQDMVTIVRFRAVYLTPADYVEELTDSLDTMIDDGARLIVLDFKNVEEGCPELIDMLRHLQVRLKELNGHLALSHTEYLNDMLKRARTDKPFHIYPDPRAAFKALKPY
jgi:hypothetical protein